MLGDVCHAHGQTLNGVRTFAGDLQTRFVVTDRYWMGLPGLTYNKASDQATYIYLGPNCPQGLPTRHHF